MTHILWATSHSSFATRSASSGAKELCQSSMHKHLTSSEQNDKAASRSIRRPSFSRTRSYVRVAFCVMKAAWAAKDFSFTLSPSETWLCKSSASVKPPGPEGSIFFDFSAFRSLAMWIPSSALAWPRVNRCNGGLFRTTAF